MSAVLVEDRGEKGGERAGGGVGEVVIVEIPDGVAVAGGALRFGAEVLPGIDLNQGAG